MKKTDKESNAIPKLRFAGETIRILRPGDLEHVAGGTSYEGAQNPKRPVATDPPGGTIA